MTLTVSFDLECRCGWHGLATGVRAWQHPRLLSLFILMPWSNSPGVYTYLYTWGNTVSNRGILGAPDGGYQVFSGAIT